jgi:diadenylate cyclase
MLKDFFTTFHWRDTLDILFVCLVIYRIFVVFKGTRAVQMLVGLGVVVAALALARQLDLPMLGWVGEHFWSFWVIAFVVLFQPELRRALTRLGQGQLVQSLFGGSRDERTHVVDEIVTAAEALSTRHAGALIVLERGTGLRQYAELGVGLDALVSADLLISIFLPPTPLHDGAVLIQGARIVAASCFLPLSRSLHPGRPIGSRHRAALGITEETDAVAVTVSEETGRVSLAVEGIFESPATMDEMRRRLHEYLGDAPVAESRGSFLRAARRLLLRASDNA